MGRIHMILAPERITELASERRFQAVMLEKVIHLLHVLESLNSHPHLKNSWALKGGTALNVFLFNVPRLSVDIDLNYIGNLEKEKMLDDRQRVELAFTAVFAREGYTIKRKPIEQAGGKWILSYQSFTGGPCHIEVDFNYMYREPLWEITKLDSVKIGSVQARNIPILNQHELAAGKLAALFSRTKARDVYDTVHIFKKLSLDLQRVRLAFIVYGGMSRLDWRSLSLDSLTLEPEDIATQLLPVLHNHTLSNGHTIHTYCSNLLSTAKELLRFLFPLSLNERTLLDLLLDDGVIDATVLTNNQNLQHRIESQPLLAWKAMHVTEYKALRL